MQENERVLGRLEEFQKSAEKRFDALEIKVGEWTDFKISTLVHARWVAMIVSSVCGLLTMLGTIFLTAYLKK
jgi:hypothetical protein